MSIAELILAVIAIVPGAIALAIAKRRGWAFARVERPPVPIAPLGIAAIAATIGGAVGFFAATMIVGWIVEQSYPRGLPMTVTGPGDVLLVWLHEGLVGAIALALPGACALAWLLSSRERRPRAAIFFGILVALGYLAGAGLGALVVPRSIAALTAQADFGGAFQPTIDLADITTLVADMLLAFGAAGATLVAIAYTASRSADALRNALALSAIAPGASLLIAAWLTPPDVVSQMIAAFALVAAWTIGLALALAVRALALTRTS